MHPTTKILEEILDSHKKTTELFLWKTGVSTDTFFYTGGKFGKKLQIKFYTKRYIFCVFSMKNPKSDKSVVYPKKVREDFMFL